MDFELSEELQACHDLAETFSKEKLQPNAEKWDREAIFPIETLREAAKLGFAGITVAENVGGSQFSRLASAIIFEQLSAGCISSSAYLSIHNMVAATIDRYGNDALRNRWCPLLTSMQLLASYCLTEPDAGSDAASLKTRAVRQGENYIVNGQKAFISGGGVSDLYLCMVRTGDDSPHGISCLIIEKNTPGLTFGHQEKKMGWKSQPTSMVFFQDCVVPVNQRVGEEGEGFKIALNALNGGRVNIAACSLGGASACLDVVKTYVEERKQFGSLLKDMQNVRFTIADMLTDLESARLMVYKAADALDKNLPNAVMQCAMAKRLATDVAFRISDHAMQLFGGYGYLNDYPIERIFRDLRVHRILEGTNEIMREVIARNFFK